MVSTVRGSMSAGKCFRLRLLYLFQIASVLALSRQLGLEAWVLPQDLARVVGTTTTTEEPNKTLQDQQQVPWLSSSLPLTLTTTVGTLDEPNGPLNRSTKEPDKNVEQVVGDDWAVIIRNKALEYQQQRKAIVESSKNDITLMAKALRSLQNPRLFGGDILIKSETKKNGGREQRVQERSALVSLVSLWPEGIIFYELDPSVEHLTGLIWRVMQQFHDETCIKFLPRQNNEPDYLRIEAYRGCFSYIGRIGGEQTLSLGDGCEYRGTIAHELLHAVGFYHHQNRSDRDQFLDIIWENIARGKEVQFAKMAPQENLLLNEFDYNSIMLYGPRTFGKTIDKVTMKPKRKGVTLLEVMEKKGLSVLDIDSVNKLYECELNIKR